MNNTKKVYKRKFYLLRILICMLVIVSAIVLKQLNLNEVNELAQIICTELKVDDAIEVLSFKNSSEIIEVFNGDNIQEKQENTYDEYYIEKSDIQKMDEEYEKKRRAEEEETKRLSVETLSFFMSEEETLDNTEATIFRIPPPKSCSYEEVEIKFNHCTPVAGKITSKFGYRDHPLMDDSNFHTGVDIAAPLGKKVVAFSDGVVKDSGMNSTYGNYILIEHSNGISSFYGHNSKLFVKKGSKVRMGQKISEIGSTGMSTGPHLHFEIRKNDIRVNPIEYIS